MSPAADLSRSVAATNRKWRFEGAGSLEPQKIGSSHLAVLTSALRVLLKGGTPLQAMGECEGVSLYLVSLRVPFVRLVSKGNQKDNHVLLGCP